MLSWIPYNYNQVQHAETELGLQSLMYLQILKISIQGGLLSLNSDSLWYCAKEWFRFLYVNLGIHFCVLYTNDIFL
jgi:hypothetical protein